MGKTTQRGARTLYPLLLAWSNQGRDGRDM